MYIYISIYIYIHIHIHIHIHIYINIDKSRSRVSKNILAARTDVWGQAEHECSRNPPIDRGVFAGVELKFSCVSENILGECNDVCGYNENQVMGMFEKAEQEYQDVMEKKRIVENDKRKIEMVMHELDEKKNQALKTTWTKVCVCVRARE